MAYWWVNHNQTARYEISGGYIWSPMKNKDGSRNQTYLNLLDAKERDIVFSYAERRLGALGIVERCSYECERPALFGKTGAQWGHKGWAVGIRWIVLERQVRPSDHLKEIVPLLPDKYSPIRSNGYGNQKFYLIGISAHLGNLLVSLIQDANPSIRYEIAQTREAVADDIEERRLAAGPLPPTEKDQLIKARRGQGLFRFNLEKIERACRLTGLADKRFLVASHIKPWRFSTDAEKLDGNNGLLLSPHIDRLFDRGWVTIGRDGRVVCANEAVERALHVWRLDREKVVGPFTLQQEKYLEYHRSKVFKK